MELMLFDYELPQELIAQEPLKERTDSKMLVLDLSKSSSIADAGIAHRHFYDLPQILMPGDVVVMNNTKVIPARIRGKKATGGKFEMLVLRILSERVVLCSLTRRVHPGTRLLMKDNSAIVTRREKDIFTVEFDRRFDLEKLGEMPTPPYIKKKLLADEQYQTVYAKTPGSVAAPTAGLHFTEKIIHAIKSKGVKVVDITLHVGQGTFHPVREDNVKLHKMHREWYSISTETADIINRREGKLFVVGTTTLRALESATNKQGSVVSKTEETDIFIYPGYDFRLSFDYLLTNFHLPKSTLLMLVSAVAGRQRILKAYTEAIGKDYRFYSFGDCMLLRL